MYESSRLTSDHILSYKLVRKKIFLENPEIRDFGFLNVSSGGGFCTLDLRTGESVQSNEQVPGTSRLHPDCFWRFVSLSSLSPSISSDKAMFE